MQRATSNIPEQQIIIRRATPLDRPAIDRVAILAESRARPYESLVAELDGQIVAAISLDGATVIANPFVRTAALVDVLRDQVGAPGELSATPRRFLPALRPLRR